MPLPGLRWRHVIVSTYASWLPGDPRGFRAEGHKVHSSGDYHAPPPEGEHEGLHRYSKDVSGRAVVIPVGLREAVGRAIVAKLRKLGWRVLAVAVAGMHVHFLAELPDDLKKVRSIVGECKRVASVAVKDVPPGRVWAHAGKFKAVNTIEYQHKVFGYIQRQENAWSWTFRDDA